jgi:hypothetical protein
MMTSLLGQPRWRFTFARLIAASLLWWMAVYGITMLLMVSAWPCMLRSENDLPCAPPNWPFVVDLVVSAVGQIVLIFLAWRWRA